MVGLWNLFSSRSVFGGGWPRQTERNVETADGGSLISLALSNTPPRHHRHRVKLPAPARSDSGSGSGSASGYHYSPWLPLQLLTSAAAVVPLAIMERHCPDTAPRTTPTFRTPLVPWLPGLGAFFNWFLLAQLTWQGLWMVGAYILASLALYFLYGYRNSIGALSGCVLGCWMWDICVCGREGDCVCMFVCVCVCVCVIHCV
jgi:hypothetical protein